MSEIRRIEPGRGVFITLEGIEGVGKTSSLATIEATLTEAGRAPLLTREPGGTVLGERIRDWVLHAEHGELTGEIEALLMFAARAYHLKHVIVPALGQGRWVVCDRFTDATVAYQGGGRAVPQELLECLTRAVHQGLEPDLTLLLDAPVAVGRERIGGREADHFEREDVGFFERVRQAYLALAAEHPRRIVVIDAARPRQAVQRDIEAALQRFTAELEHR